MTPAEPRHEQSWKCEYNDCNQNQILNQENPAEWLRFGSFQNLFNLLQFLINLFYFLFFYSTISVLNLISHIGIVKACIKTR